MGFLIGIPGSLKCFGLWKFPVSETSGLWGSDNIWAHGIFSDKTEIH